MTFTNASSTPLPEVYLRLWDNYHGSCPSTPITVTNVTGGTAGALRSDCTAMKITLPTPLAQGQSGTVGFDLSIVVPNGADRFGHDGAYNMIGNALPVLAVRDGAGWHLDPYTNNGESFYTLISDFDVTLVHPTSLLTPATGTSTETRQRQHDRTTHADRVEGPRLRVGRRAVREDHRHLVRQGREGQRLLGQRDLARVQRHSMLTLAADAIDVHSGRFGDYPYGEVDVVLDNNFWFGGMEYPGFVMDLCQHHGAGARAGAPVVLRHRRRRRVQRAVAGRGLRRLRDRPLPGHHGSGCGHSRGSRAREADQLDGLLGRALVAGTRTVVYGYGKCTLHDLQRLIGDTAMANLLKSYAQSHWYGVSTTAEFKAAAQAAAGRPT